MPARLEPWRLTRRGGLSSMPTVREDVLKGAALGALVLLAAAFLLALVRWLLI
jgi:hypothetical protein